MSRIIKPNDEKIFRSARKFRKRAFLLEPEPADHRPAHKDDLLSESETKLLTPEDLVEEAQRKAGEILREAESNADEIRKKAREQGRAEGLKKLERKANEQLQAHSRTISSFIDQMKAREAELMESLTPRLANLATELAQRILHREIEKDPSVVTLQAEKAIGKILEREKLVIRVNPADAEHMKKHKPALIEMFSGIKTIEIAADPAVERGGCVVETDLVRVDAQPCSQLEAARKTLLDEDEK